MKLGHSITVQLLHILLVVMCPVAFLIIANYNGNAYLLVLLAILCLLLIIINIIIHCKYLRKSDFFSPGIVFPVAYVFILGIGLIALSMEVGYYSQSKVDQNDLYYYLVGLLCYVYGNIFAFLLHSHKIKSSFRKTFNMWGLKQLFEWGCFLTFIGSMCVFIYYLKTGVPFFGDVDRIRHGVHARLYGVGFSFQLLQGLSFIFLIYLIYSYNKNCFAKWMLIPIFWIAFLTALTGYRSVCILFIFVPFTGYHYIVTRFKFNVRRLTVLFLISIVAVSVLNLLGYQRKVSKLGGAKRYLHNLEIMNIPAKYKYYVPAMLSLQIPPLNFSKLKFLVPDKYHYLHGQYTLAQIPILSRIIPLVSGEKINVHVTDVIFGLDYRGGSGGTALTIIGSLYIEYGLRAIILGMSLIGFFLETSYLRLIKIPSLLNVTIYSVFLWIVNKWIVSGVYIGDLLILIPILLIDFLIKKTG